MVEGTPPHRGESILQAPGVCTNAVQCEAGSYSVIAMKGSANRPDFSLPPLRSSGGHLTGNPPHESGLSFPLAAVCLNCKLEDLIAHSRCCLQWIYISLSPCNLAFTISFTCPSPSSPSPLSSGRRSPQGWCMSACVPYGRPSWPLSRGIKGYKYLLFTNTYYTKIQIIYKYILYINTH